jgi:hypothetical protein
MHARVLLSFFDRHMLGRTLHSMDLCTARYTQWTPHGSGLGLDTAKACTSVLHDGCTASLTSGARAGLLFHWFKPPGAGSCSFNVGVITASIVLFLVFTVVSISPLVPNGSLFPSAVISLYCVYLAYGALQSEPHTEQCNGLGHEIDAASGSTLAIGMVLMLLAVVYSAFKCAFCLPQCLCCHPAVTRGLQSLRAPTGDAVASVGAASHPSCTLP